MRKVILVGQIDHFVVTAGWLCKNPKIGTCYIDRARGSETISFEFERSWLSEHPNLLLDPDLQPMPGRQYVPKGKASFGFLSDAAPDRWGRKLMDRREVIDARTQKRAVRRLMESDYLLGVHDGGRMGGIRFQDDNGAFLSDREALAAPPITELRKLQDASFLLEENSGEEERWIRTLIEPGSSLGGARPKANVVSYDGSLWIAKFPSRHDDWDIGAWEMVAHDLAGFCGIRVAQASLERFSDKEGTYLVRRFDRYIGEKKEERVHFASAMNLLGETDGASGQHSYLDLVGILEAFGSETEEDVRELWRRMVFSICISNADDHLRNHGFLLVNDAWRLSPSYDVNPVPDQEWLSLCIDFDNSARDLRLAMDVAEYFRIGKSEARETAEFIQKTIRKNWPLLAENYGISRNERVRMAPAFAECERSLK